MFQSEHLRQRALTMLHWVVSPEPGRNRVQMDWEEMAAGTQARLVTRGMTSMGLPELEIVDCPTDAMTIGYVQDLMRRAITAVQRAKRGASTVTSGVVINLHRDEDPIWVSLEDAGRNTLRLTDPNPDTETQSPRAALAAFMVARANENPDDTKALETAFKALVLHQQASQTDDIARGLGWLSANPATDQPGTPQHKPAHPDPLTAFVTPSPARPTRH